MSRAEYLPTDPAELQRFAAGTTAPWKTAAERSEAMFQHYLKMAELDLRYARWCCGMQSRTDPAHADMLKRFDEWLTSKGLTKPEPYREPTFSLDEGWK